MRSTLCLACGGTRRCDISVRSSGLRVTTRLVVLLLGGGFVSVAQLIVSPLQIGGCITLCTGSIGLLDECPSPRHFFRRLAAVRGTATGHTAQKRSYEG